MRDLKPKVTSAHVIALIALFASLGGTVYAAATINGKSIRKGSIPANRVKPDSLTGVQIDERKLATVPSAVEAAQAARAVEATKAAVATRAELADQADRATEAVHAQRATSADVAVLAQTAENATQAQDADTLSGRPADQLQLRCNDGAVKAFANLKGVLGGEPEVTGPLFNCTNSATGIEKTRIVDGEYRLVFPNLGLGTPAASASGLNTVVSIGADLTTAPANDYRVKVFSAVNGVRLGAEPFSVVIF